MQDLYPLCLLLPSAGVFRLNVRVVGRLPQMNFEWCGTGVIFGNASMVCRYVGGWLYMYGVPKEVGGVWGGWMEG